LEEIALLNIGSRPARRAEARSLADLRAIAWVFAWSENRHFIPGWYGVGSGLQTFLEVRGSRGESLLKRMFNESRLFRLIVDEVEKTLGSGERGGRHARPAAALEQLHRGGVRGDGLDSPPMEDSLYFSEQHLQVRDTVRDFAQQVVKPSARRYDLESRFPWDNVKQMAGL